MRANGVTILLATIVFLGSPPVLRAEGLTWISDEEIHRQFSPMAYVGTLEIRFWPNMPGREDALMAQIHSDALERRCIVTRKQDAAMPTWDGHTPAFIFDPAIWYFDPDYPDGALLDDGGPSDEFTTAQELLETCYIYAPPANIAGISPEAFENFAYWMSLSTTKAEEISRVQAMRRRLMLLARLHGLGQIVPTARPEPKRFPGCFDKREEMDRDNAIQARALAKVDRTAAVRDFDAAMMDLQLGFLCSSPGNPADVRSILDSPKPSNEPSWALFTSCIQSEQQLIATTSAYARRRRLIAESPVFMFAPWISHVDPGSTVLSDAALAWRNPIGEVSPAAVPSGGVSERHTLLDFMLENPNLALPAERPRAWGLFR